MGFQVKTKTSSRLTNLELVAKIVNKKVNLIYFLVVFAIVFMFLRILPHAALLWQFWGLDTVGFVRFMEVFWSMTIGTLFDSTATSNFFAFAFPVLLAINIILFKEYYQTQKVILSKRSATASISGMFLGLFGVGCFACSGLLLAPLISALGLTGVIVLLPYGGRELAYVGLMFIIASIWYLLRKLRSPMVCE